MLKNKRQRTIYKALVSLGGRAGTRAIAGKCDLDANSVSQTLGRMNDDVMLAAYDSEGREWVWAIR